MPTMPSPSNATQSGLVASWSFDNIDPDDVVSDSIGNNPAVLGGTSATGSYTPVQVNGKFGKALSFNGQYYALVQPSPSLEISNEVTIDVWVNVQSIKNASYNNIFVEAIRTTAALPTRTLGLAINGESPQNASSPPQGALRGYVMTQNGVLNEIDTKQPVPLNQWIHIVFTRSLTTGMHIYIDDQEQQVQVVAGVSDPAGPIQRQTEIYIGHDSITNIDQLQISNSVEPQGQPLWMQWWIWAIIAAAAVGGLLFYFKKVSNIIIAA